MAAGEIKIDINCADPATGIGIQESFTIPVSAPVGTVTYVNLTTTPTALSIPTGASWALIKPPSSNTNNIKISGATGETIGAVLDADNILLLPLPAASGSIFLFAAGAVTGVTVVFL